ncbi:hypothetical protein ERJ75_001205600 [Trypanosoma vivax]|nr:hypothetical protein ERJ75_001205600 [Trypanosoma vivax]
MSVHTNLVWEYRKLNEEHGRLVTDIADAGAVSQLEIVSEAQYNADVKFWEAMWLKNEACSAIGSLVGVIDAWQDTLFEGKNAHQQCNSSFMRAEHNASHSFAVLYAELAKNVDNFSAFSNSHNAFHYQNVRQKINSAVETLKKAEKLSVLAAEPGRESVMRAMHLRRGAAPCFQPGGRVCLRGREENEYHEGYLCCV